MVDWQQKLTNYISVYLLCSKKFVRNILLLVHLLSLLRWNWWACSLPLPIKDYSRVQASLQHLLAFSGISHFTHISVSKLMLKQSQLCASSELTQISDKLYTITAVESTIVVTITKLQITNINKIRILKVY